MITDLYKEKDLINMPRNKPYAGKIPAFYRKQTIDILLFAHVTALQQYQMPIVDAIQNFRDTYGLTEDEISIVEGERAR